MAGGYQWYAVCAINILLLLCQGTCLVRQHSASESFTSAILTAWRACRGDADRAGAVICSPERYKVSENTFFLWTLLHLVAIITHLYCQDQN